MSLSLSVFPRGSHHQPGKATNSAEKEEGGGKGSRRRRRRSSRGSNRTTHPPHFPFFRFFFSRKYIFPGKNEREKSVGNITHFPTSVQQTPLVQFRVSFLFPHICKSIRIIPCRRGGKGKGTCMESATARGIEPFLSMKKLSNCSLFFWLLNCILLWFDYAWYSPKFKCTSYL